MLLPWRSQCYQVSHRWEQMSPLPRLTHGLPAPPAGGVSRKWPTELCKACSVSREIDARTVRFSLRRSPESPLSGVKRRKTRENRLKAGPRKPDSGKPNFSLVWGEAGADPLPPLKPRYFSVLGILFPELATSRSIASHPWTQTQQYYLIYKTSEDYT